MSFPGPTTNWPNSRESEASPFGPKRDFPRTHTLKVKKRIVIDTILGKIQPESPAAATSGGSPSGGARGITHIIAEVSKRDLADITPEATLGDDLDLDSLGRVELLSAMEAELGVYLD